MRFLSVSAPLLVSLSIYLCPFVLLCVALSMTVCFIARYLASELLRTLLLPLPAYRYCCSLLIITLLLSLQLALRLIEASALLDYLHLQHRAKEAIGSNW